MPPGLIDAVFFLLIAFFALMFLRAGVRVLVVERARALLRSLGKKALDKQPDEIRLVPLAAPRWSNPAAIAALTEPLRALGFKDCGAYAIDKIPNVQMLFLVNESAQVGAYVKEHPKLGAWLELGVRYVDGSALAVVNLPATGIKSSPYYRKISVDPAAPAGELYDRLMRERLTVGLKPLTPENVVAEFEDAYRRGVEWQKKRGLSAEDVASVARLWAQKRRAGRTSARPPETDT